ncbi:MAG: hypothetical protein Q8903_15495 [Bacteroidota bacterium]|nr:hypothetical protein [Bacteroidota bacterium]
MKTGFITIGLLLFLVYLPISVPASKANIVTSEGTTAAYQPYIISPSNMGYYSNVLTLNVSFRSEVFGNVKYTMVYSLDGQENKSLPLTDHYFSWVQGEHDKCYDDGSVTLPELANGLHNVTVYLQCDWAIGYSTGWVDRYYNDIQTVFFTIMDPTSQSPASTETPNIPESHSIIEEQRFTINQKLWAFDGYHPVCSFNATANDYLEFNTLAVNSDPERPSDVFLAEFKIESINHGASYVSGNMLSQKVNLNYTDTYTVFVAKHPFYATITVTGTIDVKSNDNTINPTNSPSLTPTLSPELSPTPSPFPSSYPEQPFLMPAKSANQTSSNNVIHTIDPDLVLCSIAAILAVATIAFVYFKKSK